MNETSMGMVFDAFREFAQDDPWLLELCGTAEQVWDDMRHGDLARWERALAALPAVTATTLSDLTAAPQMRSQFPAADLRETLMQFHPWRKGPLRLGGQAIDTEWRSDWKWERLIPHVNLAGCRVLDIGCGNGYYGWRMLEAGASLVIGVDPTLVFVMQWLACRHFVGDQPNFVFPLGVEQLPEGTALFDYVFSMGVLYHRRDHIGHLSRIYSQLKPGGTAILETLVLPPEEAHNLLVPPGRYARMRNVWAIPGVSLVEQWLLKAGFEQLKRVDVTVTTTDEQRSTEWMHFESLDKVLDPSEPGLTVEGHPAPRRAIWVARRGA
jgi:tRNA (mo5U34)-methyltransferase